MFFITDQIISFFLPYLITIISTVSVCVVYYRNKRMQAMLGARRGGQQNSQSQQSNVSRETFHFIKVISCLVFGYSVTCLPYLIYPFRVSTQFFITKKQTFARLLPDIFTILQVIVELKKQTFAKFQKILKMPEKNRFLHIFMSFAKLLHTKMKKTDFCKNKQTFAYSGHPVIS